MTCNLFCVYHDNTKLEEIKQYEHLIPYNINECNNGNMNRFICEYICQQNNINTDSDCVGFCNVGRYIKNEIVEDFYNDDVNFYIYQHLSTSPKSYIGDLLWLSNYPELCEMLYKYLESYGVNTDTQSNWARYELYITKKEEYNKIVKFVNGALDILYKYFECDYTKAGSHHIVEDIYMKDICKAYNDGLFIERLEQGDWYINKNSKFYNTVNEEIEYGDYVQYKYNSKFAKLGNQLHRVIAYLIEYLIGLYICTIDGSYKIKKLFDT